MSTNSTSPSHETFPPEDLPEPPAEEGRDSRGHSRHSRSGHSHSHSGPLDLDAGEARRVRIVLGVIVGALVLATVVGLFVLWPGKSSLIGSRSFTAEGGSVGKATITSVDLSGCQSAVSALTEVNGVKQEDFSKGHVCARITEGEGKGLIMPVQLVGEPRKLAHAGDRLVVLYSPQAILSGSPYSFIDYQRQLPVGALAIVYLVLVVAVAGRKGVLSVLGLLVATGVLAFFMIPALLSGSHPLAVTLVGSMAMMLAAVYVAHGVSIRTTTALLGTVAGIVLTVLLALWEMAVRAGWISRTFIASPAEIIVQLQNLLLSGELWLHLGASLRRLLIGWGLGSALGIMIGLMIGLSRVARGTLLPLVSALFPVPKIALLPLFLVWFGIDEGSKVATILIGTLFPTVIATYAAVDNVDRNLIRMGQSFGLPPAAIVRKIILPGAMPGIFAGFRISISIAITMLVVAEMMNADRGVGAYIAAAGQLYQMDQLLAGVTLLALLGIVLSWLLGVCERRVLRWRE